MKDTNWLIKTFYVVLGTLLLTLISGCGATPAADTNAPANAPNAAPIKVTVTELYRAYMEDKTSEKDFIFAKTHKADAVYKDKMILLSGTIWDVGTDSKKRSMILLEPENPKPGSAFMIQVFPVDAEAPKLANLKKGQQITILGKLTGTKGDWLVVNEGVLQ